MNYRKKIIKNHIMRGISLALTMALLLSESSIAALASTTAPSVEPVVTVTAEPTEEPTEEPASEPTEVPTEEPTSEPTEVPTEEPADAPEVAQNTETVPPVIEERQLEDNTLVTEVEFPITYTSNDGKLSYTITEDGHLTVDGTGEFVGTYDPAWAYYKNYIKTADVNLSGFTNANDMFHGCTYLESVDLSDCDFSSAEYMNSAFYGCTSLTSIDLSGLDFSNVGEGHGGSWFSGCTALKSVNLNGTVMPADSSAMFSGCTSLEEINLKKADFSNVIDMNSMFFQCTGLKSIDMTAMDLPNVTSMKRMFHGCTVLEEAYLSGINVPSLTMLGSMFEGCTNLQTVYMSSMETSEKEPNEINLVQMFDTCTSLSTLKLSTRYPSNVTGVGKLLYMCTSLEEVDLSSFTITCGDDVYTGFDRRQFHTYNTVFLGCSSLKKIKTPNITSSLEIVLPSVNGKVDSWIDSKTRNYLPLYKYDGKTSVLNQTTGGMTVVPDTASYEFEAEAPYLGRACVKFQLKDNSGNVLPNQEIMYWPSDGDNNWAWACSDSEGYVQILSSTYQNDTDEDDYDDWRPEIYLCENNTRGEKLNLDIIVHVTLRPLAYTNEVVFSNEKEIAATLEVEPNLDSGTSGSGTSGSGTSGSGTSDSGTSGDNASFAGASADVSKLKANVDMKINSGSYFTMQEVYDHGKRDLIIKVAAGNGGGAGIGGSVYSASGSLNGIAEAELNGASASVEGGLDGKTTAVWTIENFDENNEEHLEQLAEYYILYYFAENALLYTAIAEALQPEEPADMAIALGKNCKAKIGVLEAVFDTDFGSEEKSVLKSVFSAKIDFSSENEITVEAKEAGEGDDSFSSEYSFHYDGKCDGIATKAYEKLCELFGDDEEDTYVELATNYNVARSGDLGRVNDVSVGVNYRYSDKLKGLSKYLVISADGESMTKLRERALAGDKKAEKLVTDIDNGISPFVIEYFMNSDMSGTYADYYKWSDGGVYETSGPFYDWVMESGLNAVYDEMGISDTEGIPSISFGGAVGAVGEKSFVDITGETYWSGEERIYDMYGTCFEQSENIKNRIDETALDLGAVLAKALAHYPVTKLKNLFEEANSSKGEPACVGEVKVLSESYESLIKTRTRFSTTDNADASAPLSLLVYEDAILLNASGEDGESGESEAEPVGVTSSVGDMCIIQFRDDDGNYVSDISDSPAQLTLQYTEDMLTAAGVSSADAGKLAIYRFSKRLGGYLRVGGIVDVEAQTVEADITAAGQYVLGIDTSEPAVKGVHVTDTSFPRIDIYLKGVEDFTACSVKLDDEEIIGMDNVADCYDTKYQRLSYLSDHTIPEGSHTLTVSVADESGNVMKEPYSYTWDHVVQEAPMAMYSSLTLGGKIGVNTYLKIPECLKEDTEAYVQVNDREYFIKDMEPMTVDGEELYRFSAEVSAKNMYDDVFFKVYDGDGNECLLLNSEGDPLENNRYVFSVKQYADIILKESTDTAMKELVTAMMNYGDYAAEYFGMPQTETPSGELAAKMKTVTDSVLSGYGRRFTGELTGLKYYGSSLLLRSGTTIRHYFETTGENTIDDFSFFLNEKSITPAYKNGKYYIDITGIPASDLDEIYVITIEDSEGVKHELSYGALSYAYNALHDHAGNDLVNLMKALYLYNRAADAYFQ